MPLLFASKNILILVLPKLRNGSSVDWFFASCGIVLREYADGCYTASKVSLRCSLYKWKRVQMIPWLGQTHVPTYLQGISIWFWTGLSLYVGEQRSSRAESAKLKMRHLFNQILNLRTNTAMASEYCSFGITDSASRGMNCIL